MSYERLEDDAWRELAERARRGDGDARRGLIERCREPLLERVRFMMGADARRAAESSDFVDSVVLEALRSPDGAMFTDARRLLRWMTAAARNNIRDEVRRRRETALVSLAGSSTAVIAAEQRSPATEADHAERLELVVEVLEELTPEQRRVVELRELEQRTFGDIASELGGTDDRVRLVHAKAMLRLGELLARRGL